MDRTLKWRFLALLGIVLFCVATLVPSFSDTKSLPGWFNSLFSKRINLGLDLQGGKHIVYNIALDRAVDDRASDVKRDLESRFIDEKIQGTIKTPQASPTIPVGAIAVYIADSTARTKIQGEIKSDYESGRDAVLDERKCAPDEKDAICYEVSAAFADGLKKSALSNAVNTIRERINEKGVAEPTVVEKGDDIIVELPGDPKSQEVLDTKELIARTAKLEFKVVDDGPDHQGSPYMNQLFAYVNGNKKMGTEGDKDAADLKITPDIDQWRPEEGGGAHHDPYLFAHDRDEVLAVDEAKSIGCLNAKNKDQVKDGKLKCSVSGRHVIERYLKALVAKDPKFKVPDDKQIGYELVEPQANSKDKSSYWRTYYLDRAVRLTGTGISNAMGSYDPNTNRPIVLLDFNRYGSRVFGDLTAQIVGQKLATILDDKVKSAPIINGAIRGGRASITMGGSDPTHQEQERDELVNVLKTGSLPAPLVPAQESDVGPSLGRDAIDKTKLSFAIGILLVVIIMVGVYRWSGWIAVFAVVFHILMTLAVMALFGATLTLPGVAAIVLSIGMEVDGNILIYERIRDELNLGKSVRGAIDLGFSRAFSAILDGQLTTAAAGWVLLQYGSGPIKGFAVMLLVGVFTTLTTNIWVTRIFFDWTVSRKKGVHSTISI